MKIGGLSMSQNNEFTKEHYNNIVNDVKRYYSKEFLTKTCKDNDKQYTDKEILVLNLTANELLKTYIFKDIKRYFGNDYRIIVLSLQKKLRNLNNCANETQRNIFEIDNSIITQTILFVKGEFETDGSKEIK